MVRDDIRNAYIRSDEKWRLHQLQNKKGQNMRDYQEKRGETYGPSSEMGLGLIEGHVAIATEGIWHQQSLSKVEIYGSQLKLLEVFRLPVSSRFYSRWQMRTMSMSLRP